MKRFFPICLALSLCATSISQTRAADALSGVPFFARWQTQNASYASQDKAPAFGLYLDEACTRPATHEGDYVAAIKDELSGSGLVLVQGDSEKQATLQFVNGRPVLRFDGVNDNYVVSSKIPLADLHIWARYKINDAPPSPYASIVSGHAINQHDFLGNGFRLMSIDYQRSTGQNVPQVAHMTGQPGSCVVTMEGVPIFNGQQKEFFNGTAEEICVGGRISPVPSDFLSMDLEAIFLTKAISPEQVTAIGQYLGIKSDAPRLVCVGDSITDGTLGNAGVFPTQEYPSQLQLLRPDRLVINAGQWGANIGSVQEVDSLFTPGGQLIVFVGTNDLIGPKSADEVFTQFSQYCQARRDVGWQVYVGTVLPRAGENVPADFEAKRQAFNENLRSNYSGFADGLVDFASDPRVGEAGDENDPTYFSADHVHLSAAGYSVLAEVANKALPLK